MSIPLPAGGTRSEQRMLMVDRSLLAAAACFTGATVLGAIVSLKEDIPGEPLGIQVPGSIPIQLAAGLGSGLSAPWPMPVAALMAALHAHPRDTRPGRTCTVIGSVVLAGTLVEPAAWGKRRDSRLVRATVALNLLVGSALIITGRRAMQKD